MKCGGVMNIHMIVAAARNRVIGNAGDMPWTLPSDLQNFKKVTMGKPMIMGRKTWDSIGNRPLPSRPHIILSSQAPPLQADDLTASNPHQNVAYARDPETALQIAENFGDTVMIIGGGEIYKIFEPRASRIYLTEVEAEPEGDTYFTLATPQDWQEIARTHHKASARDSHNFSLVTLERKTF